MSRILTVGNLMPNATFYTRQAMEMRITEIRSSIPQDSIIGETAPDGRFISEINRSLYAEIEFLESVLNQSIITFPVTAPNQKFL